MESLLDATQPNRCLLAYLNTQESIGQGLALVLLCVPFFFVDSARCQFTVVLYGFPVFTITGIIHILHSNWIDCRDAFHTALCSDYSYLQTAIHITY